MKRGFLKNAKANGPRKSPVQEQSVSRHNPDFATTNKTGSKAVVVSTQSLEAATHRVLDFQFSDVCRLYSADPLIVLADPRLRSSSYFLYLPSKNANIVFIDSLDGVQAMSNWQVLKEPCPPHPDPPFIIRPSGSKGLGMFATRALARGSLIMRERPVYVSHPSLSISADQKHLFYTSVIAGLSPAAQAAITSLRNVHPETPDVGHIRGIILTNALSTKVPHAPDGPLFTGLFEHLCRANHDCTPNAHYGFCTQTFSGRLFAVRSIAEGEEITIGYTDLMANGAARRKDLKAKFRFVCGCKTCCLPPAQAAESDARRDAIGEYFAKMKDKDRLPEVGSLERVKELLAWAEEDGLVEAASILGISAMRLARRTKNYLEELKLMIVSLNYLRAVEGSESPGFATLARRQGLNSKQLAAILDNSTPETIDYRFFEGLLAAQGSR